mgnify:CR=1 FL=1
MISLEKSKKFQDEYNGYLEKTKKVKTMRVRAELDQLLKQLLLQVKEIDKQHQQLAVKNTLSDSANISKIKLSETRKKIQKLLKDYERTL